MITRPHDPALGHHDPRLESSPVSAPFHPEPAAPVCSCGRAGLHEVSRRTTSDGARFVVLSSGEVRIFHRKYLSPFSVHLPPAHPPLLRLLGWVSVLDVAEVEADLLAMHEELHPTTKKPNIISKPRAKRRKARGKK